METKQPKCDKDFQTGEANCLARDIWLGFYEDFAKRREVSNIHFLSLRKNKD
jgi:hypothetical protein